MNKARLQKTLRVVAAVAALSAITSAAFVLWLLYGPNPKPYEGRPMRAAVLLPGTDVELQVQFWPAHKFLAEYHMRLVLSRGGKPQRTVDLPLDSGGGERFNLYELSGRGWLLANRWGRWRIDVRTLEVTELPHDMRLPEHGFRGSIDTESGAGWRFIPRSEREELPVNFTADKDV